MLRSIQVAALAVLIIGSCGGLTSGQTGLLSGNVVEVLDGRTVVVETAGTRLTTQLQYLEIPGPEQPLYGAVKEHLSNLANGKPVMFRTLRVVDGKAIVWMTADGVDLSLQMIRDGAAWHEPSTTSGQDPTEAADYDHNQQMAKAEKRGVWSVPNLKTPWEVRAETEAKSREIVAARRIAHPTLVGVGEFQSDIRRPSGNHTPQRVLSQRQQLDAWVGAFATARKEDYGLQTYHDPQGRFDVVYSSPILLDFASTTGTERLECRPIFASGYRSDGGRQHVYIIGFRAISEDFRFSRARARLTMVADGRVLSFSAAKGWRGKHPTIGAEEIIFYVTSWATLKKIADAKQVEVRIDRLRAPLKDLDRELFKQIVVATQ